MEDAIDDAIDLRMVLAPPFFFRIFIPFLFRDARHPWTDRTDDRVTEEELLVRDVSS